MKLYSFYTPSHRVLLEKWFLPTIKDDYEILVKEGKQHSPSGAFKEEGWGRTMLDKVEWIIHAVEENLGDIFVYSDADVQFFRPTKHALLESIRDKDLSIQQDNPEGVLCAGFFICRSNRKTLRLWKDIFKKVASNNLTEDQSELNKILKGRAPLINVAGKARILSSRLGFNKYCLKWNYLPLEFYGGGRLTQKLWTPGINLNIPDKIMLHHANYTIGLENKIAQLKYVRGIVNKSRNSFA
jgi:hypothetical protein